MDVYHLVLVTWPLIIIKVTKQYDIELHNLFCLRKTKTLIVKFIPWNRKKNLVSEEDLCDKHVCTVPRWRLWNIIVRQVNFNRFLHPNRPPQMIFWYLVRQLEADLSKIWHFQFHSNSFSPKINLIFLKIIFVLEYQIRRTSLVRIIFNFVHIQTNLSNKTVPNFWWLKLSYKVSKKPLSGFIEVQKHIEFHLPHHKIPQPSTLMYRGKGGAWYAF